MSQVLRLRAEDLHWRSADGEIVVLDLREQRYLAVNSSGAPLWEALAQGASAGELAIALSTACRIPLERARADVERFVAALAAESLLAGPGEAPEGPGGR